MKLKLQLETVVNINKDIEKHIKKYEDTIISENLKMDVSALFDTLHRLQDQLVITKEVVQNANKKKPLFGKSNNFYIYTKSNLEKHRKFLIALKKEIRDNDEKASYSKETIDSLRLQVESEIQDIQKKLTKFNDSMKVTLEIDDSLVDLFPTIKEIKLGKDTNKWLNFLSTLKIRFNIPALALS